MTILPLASRSGARSERMRSLLLRSRPAAAPGRPVETVDRDGRIRVQRAR